MTKISRSQGVEVEETIMIVNNYGDKVRQVFGALTLCGDLVGLWVVESGKVIVASSS